MKSSDVKIVCSGGRAWFTVPDLAVRFKSRHYGFLNTTCIVLQVPKDMIKICGSNNRYLENFLDSMESEKLMTALQHNNSVNTNTSSADPNNIKKFRDQCSYLVDNFLVASG